MLDRCDMPLPIETDLKCNRNRLSTSSQIDFPDICNNFVATPAGDTFCPDSSPTSTNAPKATPDEMNIENNNIGSPVSSTTLSSHCSSSDKRGSSTKSNSSSRSANSTASGDIVTPMSPAELVKIYSSYLTDLEFEELKIYKEIWYFGQNASKNYRKTPATSLNAGYDDENGNYKIIDHDHIAFRYEILDVIGKGSFGQVIRALDHKTNTHVAIKIIRNKKRFLNQAVVELNILDELREKDGDSSHNVIHMLDYTYFRKHLCITFELMSLNLYELIKKNNYNGFSMSLIRRFCNSIVKCLRLLYKENIIHCDLKPENILLKQRGSSSIKVIDFGSSCYVNRKIYTYIQSRFYRSPEVILGLQYGTAIDMWSLGCILAELYTGFPLFPGENEVEQLACIMEIFGLPPKDVIANATRRRLFFDSRGAPRCTINSKGRKRTPATKTLSQALLCHDRSFLHFLQRCLAWDPAERLTPEEAANHEFLQPSSSSRHRSCRASAQSSGGLNPSSSSQKASCCNFARIPPSTAIISDAIGCNASISAVEVNFNETQHGKTTTNHQSQYNQTSHTQSSSILPDIKLNITDKYLNTQKSSSRSKITSSISDLDSRKQYSVHREISATNGNSGTIHTHTYSSARKILFASGTITTPSSKCGISGTSSNIKHNYIMHRKVNGSTTTVGTIVHQSNSHHNNNRNMAYSQSAGDVSTIFGHV